MRILFTNTGPWGTGSFSMIQSLMNELQALGHEVKVIFPDSDLDSPDKQLYYNNEAFEIIKFPIQNGTTTLPTFPLMITDPHPRNPYPCIFRDLTEQQLKLYFKIFEERFLKVLKSYQPDVIETEHIWGMDYVISRLGLPYVCTAHHSDQLGFLQSPRMRPYALRSAKTAKYIFAISEFVRDEVIKLYNVSQNKVIMIPNGYDNKIFYPKKIDAKSFLKQMNVPFEADATYITFAGKLSRTKGIDILLEANCYLDPSLKIHFLIFGAGEIESTLDSQKHYCFDRMHFLGHQIPEIVSQAHNLSRLSVLPSRTEGFGIAALEAMGCGIPLVVTDEGGLSSYAVGSIVPSEDAAGLATAIQNLVQMPKQDYENLCKQSLAVAQQYLWKQLVEKRLYYYELVAQFSKKTN